MHVRVLNPSRMKGRDILHRELDIILYMEDAISSARKGRWVRQTMQVRRKR